MFNQSIVVTSPRRGGHTSLLILLFSILFVGTNSQKLLVVITEGISGSHLHRFSHHSALRTFEEEGVWSNRLVPVFPTLPLPNRQTLLTGTLPKKHEIIGDYMYNWKTGETFENFTKASDLDRTKWWNIDPIYVAATKSEAKVAMFFFPECAIDWSPSISICIPPRKDTSLAETETAKRILEATRTHDLTLVYHPQIFDEMSHLGPKHANTKTATEMDKLMQSIERLTSQCRERIDLNVIFLSLHGIVEIPQRNIRVIDDYLPMELVNTTVGSGAIKQIVAKNGKTHQIFNILREHSPIPNVKVYYTAPKVGDLPQWFHYRKSRLIPDLVLIAQPGYAVVARHPTKQIPIPHFDEVKRGIAGYNNQYPDMMGVFLAYGPIFKKGFRKGPIELADVYALMCVVLRIDCNQTTGRIKRIDDILTSDARVEVRRTINSASLTSLQYTCLFVVFVFTVFSI